MGDYETYRLKRFPQASTVADGGEIVAALVGKDVKALSEELIAYGANKVVVTEHEDLAANTSDGYARRISHH